MQTFQIEVEDNIADKILWFLENLKEQVTIKRLNNSEYNNLEKSIKDLRNNNITPIGDIDNYIKDLQNEIK